MTRARLAVALGVAVIVSTVVAGPAGGVPDCSARDPFTPELVRGLAESHPGQRFTAAVHDRRTGCEYHLHRGVRITTASVFKIEVMAAVLLRAQRQGRDVTSSEWSRMVPMITESADAPTSSLFVELGGTAGFAAFHDDFGLTETSPPPPRWGATLTSAADQLGLVRQVLLGDGGPLEEAGRDLAWELMTSVVPSQRWGISAGVPDRWRVALKNGFFPLSGGGWRINTAGVVEDLNGGAYGVVILSDGWPTEAAGITAVESIAESVNAALAPRGAPPGVPFLDVAAGDWFYDAAVWAYGRGVTTGVDPMTFDPFGPVTRGRLAAFLRRALDLPPAPPGRFVDVAGSVFAEDIARLAAAGITRGCNPPAADRFCPHRRVTRGELAAMLARGLSLPPPPSGDRFVDDDASIFEGDLERMAAAGLLVGCDPPHNERICPHQDVSRAQMVVILHRVARSVRRRPGIADRHEYHDGGRRSR